MNIIGKYEGFETLLTIPVVDIFRVTKVGSSPNPEVPPLYTEIHFIRDGVAAWVRYSGDYVTELQKEIHTRLKTGEDPHTIINLLDNSIGGQDE